jgi:uncharacterized protein YhdP
VVGVTRAEPAAALPAGDAARSAVAHLRTATLVLGGALILVALLAMAYALAAVRVPQQRAALEELIRYRTGLEVRFDSLSVRWGWYGPEAVFQDVELGDAQRDGLRLRAPRLIVGLDAWRMARSGHLEAGRIVLESPDIDLAAASRTAPQRALPGAADVRGAGGRILAGWRGGEISISGGTLHTVLPGDTQPLSFGIRYAQLRRLGADFRAEAQVALPETLGASLRIVLEMHGDPASPGTCSGTLSFEGRRLELAAWAALAGMANERYLPRSGSGDFEVHAAFAHEHLQAASGRVAAGALAWRSPDAAGPAPALDRLRGAWQLTRRGGDWHLSVDALELGVPGSSVATPASVVLDAASDGTSIRGQVRHAPLAALAALARWHAPQLPNGVLVLSGEARELTFDWNARRPRGERLAASAELGALSLASPAGDLVLADLSGRVAGAEDSVAVTLRSPAARLTLPRESPVVLDGLEVNARLNATITAEGGWQLDAPEVKIRRQGLMFSASGAIAAAAAGSAPFIDTHLSLKDSDIALLARLFGPRVLDTLGAAAAALTAGRVEDAELAWRGPLNGPPWIAPGSRFAGSLRLRDASLRAGDAWPDSSGLSAQIDWHGAHFHAAIERARTDAFALTDAVADWNARAGYPAHFAGRLAGDAQQVIAWLREHPQALAWAPGLEAIDLRGATLLDLEVTLPRESAARPSQPRVHIAALLDGAQLRPVAGLPPLGALRGTLAFAGGHLQRSTLTGQWLGGPVSLAIGERRERGITVLVISGRGTMGAREALQAAGGNTDDPALSGSAEWSALLTMVPEAGSARLRLHADSSLVGIASRLPEPFAKAAGTVLPLHLDLQAGGDAGQLRLSLGERLTAIAALSRSADTWRIERGALRLAGAPAPLPTEPVVLLDGRVSRLDLPACLALWRQAARDAALPALRAHVIAAQILAGTRSFPEVDVSAEAMGGTGAVQLQSTGLSGSARWQSVIDAEHPAQVHFPHFNVVQPADAAFAAELASVLAPAAQLTVDELQWQGRPLGSFAGALAVHGRTLEASELVLSGAATETRASAHCLESACNLRFSLDSADAATALAAFGFSPELSASHARLEGQLSWAPRAPAPLATLGGRLHMQINDGIMSSTSEAAGVPFALLSVPALLAGMNPSSAQAEPAALRFTQFNADYELRDGQAVTPALHFDGDAEILVRGRVGLSSGDYDQQAWILRGEERLPAAVRRLAPTPRVAAAWLSLRELFGAPASGEARAALRLRGPWSDPIVTPVE